MNISIILEQLRFDLQRSMEHVAHSLHGLTALKEKPPALSRLPDGVPWGFGVGVMPRVPNTNAAIQLHQPFPFDIALKSSRIWILCNGLKDIITSFHLFMDNLRVLGLIALSQASGDILSQEEIVSNIGVSSSSGLKFHNYGLPNKLPELQRELGGFDINEEIEQLWECLLTINRARNCLVHRNGIVNPEKDGNSEDKSSLIVRWREAFVIEDAVTGERRRPNEKGMLELPNGGRIRRMVPIEREFPAGSQVVFSEQEFVDICWTVGALGEGLLLAIVEKIRQTAESKGTKAND